MLRHQSFEAIASQLLQAWHAVLRRDGVDLNMMLSLVTGLNVFSDQLVVGSIGVVNHRIDRISVIVTEIDKSFLGLLLPSRLAVSLYIIIRISTLN